jgi:outer membrane biosynthesis protein TonB
MQRRPATPVRLLPAVLCTLLLAACEGVSLSDPQPEPDTAAAAHEDPTAGAPESPSKAPDPEPQVAAVPPPAPEPQPEPAPAPAPGLDDDPAQLIGMGTASLAAVLGAPAQIRRESPANIWQYLAEGCVLDVVLYPEKGIDRVNYVEARAKGLEKMPARGAFV